MKKIICLFILLSQFLIAAWAQQAFVVKNIEIEGLQRISYATAMSYLPIKPGETLQPAKTAAVLRALYQTGFFDRITLSRQGDTLIIHVIERSTIGQLKISGNSVIATDKLNTVMRTLDIAEGRVYNPAMLERIKQSLLNQYYQLGRYNARVETQVTPMSRNRVLIKITISEGLVAKIRKISIIGNKVFDEKTLVKQLDITTPGLFTFITQTDRYSEEALAASLEKLRNYYMDHGYIRIAIKSSQAEITPDRKSVYVTIVVDEGEQYTLKNYEITGQLVVPRKDIEDQIHLKSGETFSRQKVVDAEKNITKLLGDKGYLFANIALRPQIDDKDRQVILVFDIKPGNRAYVRHVTFSDNNRTNDVVLRREIMQMEGAVASTSKLEDSKRRLKLLPYIREVDMSVTPGPESDDQADDQVDINYKVKEDSSAQASVKVGYSQLYRVILGAGFNQKNFLGTGNTLGVDFSRSQYEQFYGVEYTDPYYTEDGISRTFNFSISRVDPSAISNLNSGYAINVYNLGVLYGIPIGQESNVINRIMAGVGYENTLVNLNSKDPGTVSQQVNTFVNDHGRRYQEIDIKLGYSRDGRDKAIFPTSGGLQTLFLDTYVGSLGFYMLNYHGKWYFPLTDQFILTSRADLGYGNGMNGINDFPFFKNYYAGGIDSVRGYQGYTLGPRDSNDQAYGGNMLIDGSIGLIFPNYFSDNLRTSAFVDMGNVYSSLNNAQFGTLASGNLSSNSGPVRFSVGVEADWITPFGPIELSLAKPINRQKAKPNDPRRGDEEEPFQFALGANF